MTLQLLLMNFLIYMRKIFFSFLSVYLTRDFDFRFYHDSVFLRAPLRNLSKIRGDICNCVFITCIRALGKLIREKKLEAEISCQTVFKGTLLSNEKDGGLEWDKLWILLLSLYVVLRHTVAIL